ncbi:TPA: S41 family peptidase [Candidatus Poribacteria bacterium]|nr:S41 family peptidase [Candidatus Poribacteria bacterium]
MLSEKLPKSNFIRLALLIIVWHSFFVFTAVGADTGPDDKLLENISLLAEVLARIEQEHLDNPNPKDLMMGAIRGMLRTLDPYSQFFDRKSFTAFRTETGGTYGGLGMEIGIRRNQLTVISPFKGTPADEAGLKTGDIISQIDNESTINITVHNAAEKMRGEPGTPVTLTVLHEGETEPIEVKIVRDIIRIRSVESKILKSDIAYIRINQFRKTTAADVNQVFAEFKQKNLRGLILDLRSNPGGLLSSAVEIASNFLEPDQLVVYTKGKRPRRDHVALKGAKKKNYPLIVLANGGSASASEIVAAAIKDHGRGLLMGQKTFGKASVQQLFPLSGGAAVKLTIAHYYSPNGVDIHKAGIMPHLEKTWFSRSERQMLLKLRDHKKIDDFIAENGDDILNQIKSASGAIKGDDNSEETLRKYRRISDQLLKDQITISDAGLKFAIARQTKNDIDDLEYDPQIAAAIQQFNVMEMGLEFNKYYLD